MNRKDFLKICSGSCLGLLGGAILLESCSTHHIQGVINNNKIEIKKSDFTIVKNNKTSFKKYLIVRFDQSIFPIVIYRFSETNYSALLLRCTHQGNELNVSGDLLTCPAHNSEFNNKGEVVQGPAEQRLKAFPVTTNEQTIYIELI